MKKIIITFLLVVAAAADVTAQNKIDTLLDNFSTMGNCNYTSVVKRNPKTRKVQKIVKELTVINGSLTTAKQFERAFAEEAETGTFVRKSGSGNTVFTLTIEHKNFTVIYVMNRNDNGNAPQLVVMSVKVMK